MASPLGCNVYLHRLERAWDVGEHGVLVRYAADALVLCTSRQQAQAALVRLRVLLAELGLAPKQAKTRIVHLQVGGEGCDFLGFAHRLVRHAPRRGASPSPTWPAGPRPRPCSMPKIGSGNSTDRSRLWLGVGEVVGTSTGSCTAGLRTCKYGNSTRHVDKIRHYARMRLALLISKRHRRNRAFGWWWWQLPPPTNWVWSA